MKQSIPYLLLTASVLLAGCTSRKCEELQKKTGLDPALGGYTQDAECAAILEQMNQGTAPQAQVPTEYALPPGLDAPDLESITPQSVRVGDTLVLRGRGFKENSMLLLTVMLPYTSYRSIPKYISSTELEWTIPVELTGFDGGSIQVGDTSIPENMYPVGFSFPKGFVILD